MESQPSNHSSKHTLNSAVHQSESAIVPEVILAIFTSSNSLLYTHLSATFHTYHPLIPAKRPTSSISSEMLWCHAYNNHNVNATLITVTVFKQALSPETDPNILQITDFLTYFDQYNICAPTAVLIRLQLTGSGKKWRSSGTLPQWISPS
jgi:hypothetical protein